MSENSIDPTNVFGPLTAFIEDPTVEEIWINTPERIFIARNGRSELSMLLLSAEQVRNLVERLLLWSGRRLDLSVPFVDARLPDGSRLHVAIPEITAAHWAVNIRKHLMQKVSLDQLALRGVMTADMAELLRRAVAAGLNILVSGGTQAGKTTMLNALVSTIPVGERVITIEEVFELAPILPDVIAMQTRGSNLQGEGEITLRRLIKESLRMRPSRIIVGEVRESEALDLLIALNSGLPGMGTLHANSARDAIAKLQILPLLAGENISHRFIAPTIASAIDLIVHVTLDRNGFRRVSEIAVVTGRVENLNPEVDSLFTWNTESQSYVRGLGSLPHPERFVSTSTSHGSSINLGVASQNNVENVGHEKKLAVNMSLGKKLSENVTNEMKLSENVTQNKKLISR
jgi:pilus assembly protein CpaF